ADVLTETQLKESIRQLPQKSPSRPPSVSLTQGTSSRIYQEPILQLNNVEEDDEESYFGDILDKYCNSDDEDPSSPKAPSPVSFPDWRTSSNDQLPTPPSSRSSLLPVTPPPRRGAGGVAALAASLGQDVSMDSNGTRSRNNSASGTSPSPSPINPAPAKLNNMYLHPGPSRESHDSLSKLATPSSSFSQSPAPSTTRAYVKRPPPPPKDTVEPSQGRAASSSSSLQQNSHSGSWSHNNSSSSDLRDSRPEPPAKDASRRGYSNNYASNNRSSSQSTASQPPHLSLDHHHPHHQSSGHPIGSFADAVEATMNRHRAAPPGLHADTSKDILKSRSAVGPFHLRVVMIPIRITLIRSGYKATSSPPSVSSRSSSQAHSYSSERTRIQSHTSISTNSSFGRYGHSNGSLKSALLKTPIARARAKEAKGPRKVVFGEMITIVTIERTPTPPPVAPMDKKAKKKLLQSKKASAKDNKGQTQNFDPEYDAKYYDAPYTPTPAEVVITTAPWVGNPNWDEERQNSKFYYEDDTDYEYDDYEYEAPHDSDIRLGPEDDEEEDEDEDEDDDEYQARPWGRGIAGPGGALPKKKGGMFKFKRAVDRLLRN
ncbi:hypothetical protein BGZ95_003017, partial [Linnemannia exigua]